MTEESNTDVTPPLISVAPHAGPASSALFLIKRCRAAFDMGSNERDMEIVAHIFSGK